jgi:hypothetical protein
MTVARLLIRAVPALLFLALMALALDVGGIKQPVLDAYFGAVEAVITPVVERVFDNATSNVRPSPSPS